MRRTASCAAVLVPLLVFAASAASALTLIASSDSTAAMLGFDFTFGLAPVPEPAGAVFALLALLPLALRARRQAAFDAAFRSTPK